MAELTNLHYWLINEAYRASVAASAQHPTLANIAIASPYIIECVLASFWLTVQCLGLLELKRLLFGPGIITRAMRIHGKVIERYEAREFDLPDGRRVKPKFDPETGQQASLEFVQPKPPPLPRDRPLRVMDGRKTVMEIPFHHKHYD